MPNISAQLEEDINRIINNSTGIVNFSIIVDICNSNKQSIDDDIDETIKHVVSILSDNSIEIEYSDVENEDESISEEGVYPFDPSKVDISSKTLILDALIKRIRNNEIDLNPKFQRKAGLWSTTQKSRLIESILLRIPLPAFYFDGTNNNRWIIIDGLQRLTAIREFCVTKTLLLQDLEFLTYFNNSSFDDLMRTYTRRIEEAEITAYIINASTPDNVKFNIFKRINTGGLKLEAQEIRHALYQGQATDFLEKLANSDQFKRATANSVKTDRMLDREFVLRFISFYIQGYEMYKGNIDDFLVDGMKKLNKLDADELADIESKFYDSMKTAWIVFNKFAFRKQYDLSKRKRNLINKGLFEAWAVNFARLSYSERHKIEVFHDQVEKSFVNTLNNNGAFERSLNGSFTEFTRIRFQTIEKIIRSVINDT